MKTITINNVTYPAKEFDFNMVCDLQDMGVNINENTSMLTALRAYIAICMGVSVKEAGNAIQMHIVNGGNLEEATNIFNEEINTFFRLFGNEEKEEEIATTQPKKRTANKKATATE